MDTFFKLNRQKIKFAFKVASLSLISFVVVVLTIAFFTGGLPDIKLLISILLVAGVGLPTFIVCLSYLKWIAKRTGRRKAFSTVPFDELNNIGFVDTFSNLDTKWEFTEIVKSSKIDGYDVVIDISEQHNNCLELKIAVEWKKLDKTTFRIIESKFNQYQIELGIGCLKKRYEYRKHQFSSIGELKLDLEKCIELIKAEGFEPKKKGCA